MAGAPSVYGEHVIEFGMTILVMNTITVYLSY